MKVRLHTSRYQNKALGAAAYASWVKIGSTNGYPRFKPAFAFVMRKELAPPYALFRGAMDGTVSDEEFVRGYRAHLYQLGLARIVDLLRGAALEQGVEPGPASVADVVLLCYEDLSKPGESCHRTMLCDWLRDQLGKLDAGTRAAFDVEVIGELEADPAAFAEGAAAASTAGATKAPAERVSAKSNGTSGAPHTLPTGFEPVTPITVLLEQAAAKAAAEAVASATSRTAPVAPSRSAPAATRTSRSPRASRTKAPTASDDIVPLG